MARRPTQRTLDVMRSIRSGNPLTLSNRVISPLCRAGLVTHTSRSGERPYTNIRLTEAGEAWLDFYTQEDNE